MTACWDDVCYTLTIAVWGILKSALVTSSAPTPSRSASPAKQRSQRKSTGLWSSTNTKPGCVVLPRYDSSLPLTSLAVVQRGALGESRLVVGVHETLAVLWDYHTQQLVATVDIAPDDIFPSGSARSLLASSPQWCMEALDVPSANGTHRVLLTLGTPGGLRSTIPAPGAAPITHDGDSTRETQSMYGCSSPALEAVKGDHKATTRDLPAACLPPCHHLLLSWVRTTEPPGGCSDGRVGTKVDGSVRFVDDLFPQFPNNSPDFGVGNRKASQASSIPWSVTCGCAIDTHHVAMGTTSGMFVCVGVAPYMLKKSLSDSMVLTFLLRMRCM